MSTVDLIEDTLLEQMLKGQLRPGSRVGQDVLAEKLGVSKIPVREALQRLAGRGLLQFQSNRGAVVPELTATDAQENFALRRAIEPELLAKAIPRQTIVDLAEAELALTTNSSPTFNNWSFHRSLYAASGWALGLSIARILHAAVAPYVLLYLESLDGKEDSHKEHLALLDACRQEDHAAARSHLTKHLQSAETALLSYFESSSTTAEEPSLTSAEG